MAHSPHWTVAFASNMVGITWLENTDDTEELLKRVNPQVGLKLWPKINTFATFLCKPLKNVHLEANNPTLQFQIYLALARLDVWLNACSLSRLLILSMVCLFHSWKYINYTLKTLQAKNSFGLNIFKESLVVDQHDSGNGASGSV